MSCSSSSSPRVDDRRRHGKKQQAGAEEVPALDMLDNLWFFSNSLSLGSGGGGRDDGKGTTSWNKPPLLPRSPSTSAGRAKSAGGGAKGPQHVDGSDDQLLLQLQGNNKSRFYDASGARRLLRTPSLPSPRIGPKELVEEEYAAAGGGDQDQDQDQDQAPVEDDDMNWSKIYEGVLRTRIHEEGGRSSPGPGLHRAPSTPVPYSATMRGRGEEAVTRSTLTLPRLRHSHSTLLLDISHCRSHTPTKPDRDRTTPRTPGGGGGGGGSSSSSRAERRQPRRDLRSFGANQPALARAKSEFQDKKWKSSSALESIEVQGFKDLGFVFDKEELRESLADVLPGLKSSASASASASASGSRSGSASDNDDANGAGDGIVRRPYLSEAWQHGARSASASAIRLQQAESRSAAEMKDQLRMWAQAVACNVRQEC